MKSRRAFLKHAVARWRRRHLPCAAHAWRKARHPPRASSKLPRSQSATKTHGDPSGFPIILLHGFPDDVRAFDDVVPALTKAGHRALVPYLRGCGPTRFRDASAPRMAEQAAIGQDVIDFADALKLPRFALAGYDWGGRAAAIAAALHPQRVRATVLIGGYTIQNTIAPSQPGSPAAEHRIWYQYLLQHRTRSRRPAGQPPRDLPLPVAAVVAELEVHRRRVQPHRAVL